LLFFLLGAVIFDMTEMTITVFFLGRHVALFLIHFNDSYYDLHCGVMANVHFVHFNLSTRYQSKWP
jgi:hypothetical protein